MPSKNPFSFILPVLARGGVGVVPTDTIYGIVGSALSKDAVRRIYALRKRNPKKPMIILIGDVRDIGRFGIMPDRGTKKFLGKIWPGKVSVIFPIAAVRKAAMVKFNYLHRGTRALAFRLPKGARLRAFLRRAGPLVAPSANFEGGAPAKTVREAKRYFGDRVDFYLDAGRLAGNPSVLLGVRNREVTVLRGTVKGFSSPMI